MERPIPVQMNQLHVQASRSIGTKDDSDVVFEGRRIHQHLLQEKGGTIGTGDHCADSLSRNAVVVKRKRAREGCSRARHSQLRYRDRPAIITVKFIVMRPQSPGPGDVTELLERPGLELPDAFPGDA